MGNLLLRGNDVSAAKTERERAIALQPDFGNAHVNLGQLFAQSGDGTSALAQYETAIRLQPHDSLMRSRSSAINRRKFAGAIRHGRNSEQRRFLFVGGTHGWSYLLPIRGTFSEREAHDFTGCVQNLDTGSCELIVIDCPGALISLSILSFLSTEFRSRFCSYFWSKLCISRLGHGWPTTGKSAKVLSTANCGMGAAVDSGVIREHVLGFLSVPLARWVTTLGAGFTYEGVGHHWFVAPQRKHCRERRMILPANLPWRGGRRGMPAQRIG